MKARDQDLDRLLRSASGVPEEPAREVPFGFAMRVIARWRAGEVNNGAELTPFLRRIDAIALAVVLLASVGVYRQFNENETRIAPQANEYAIADTAIQTEFSR